MSDESRKCSETSCDGRCDSCGSNPENFLVKTHELNTIRRVVGVVSGKGGVGKSLVTSLFALRMSRKGYKVGILDADITGPSIPKIFGLQTRAKSSALGILPEGTAGGIKVMSINLLLEEADAPVVWRGPVIAGAVKQFWSDVIWGELDYLFVDMPPGTGDVPLTVFQSLPVDGIVIVTSPQELVSLIVKKACHMAEKMDIPILGLVENMSYVKCPDCGKEFSVFGDSRLKETAAEMKLKVLGKIPVDPEIAALCDAGEFEKFSANYLADAADIIENTFA